MEKRADLENLVEIFKDRLRTRRRAMGLTQEQLAERSGFSTNYIARLEVGRSVPSLSTLTRLSKALRIGAADFLSNEVVSVSSEAVCAAILAPLNEQERDYVLSQLSGTVDFVLSLRKLK